MSIANGEQLYEFLMSIINFIGKIADAIIYAVFTPLGQIIRDSGTIGEGIMHSLNYNVPWLTEFLNNYNLLSSLPLLVGILLVLMLIDAVIPL